MLKVEMVVSYPGIVVIIILFLSENHKVVFAYLTGTKHESKDHQFINSLDICYILFQFVPQ